MMLHEDNWAAARLRSAARRTIGRHRRHAQNFTEPPGKFLSDRATVLVHSTVQVILSNGS